MLDGYLFVYYNVIHERRKDMIALRLQPEEERIIRNYAEFNNISVSEFMRQSALEHIEDEYDLGVIRDYESRKQNGELEFVDHDQVWSELL